MTATILTTGPQAVPRRFARRDRGEGPTLALALAAAVAAVSLAFWLTPLDGTAGWVVSSFVLFLVAYYTLCRQRVGAVRAGDRLATVLMGSCAIVVLVPLVWIIGFVVAKGWSGLNANFFTETLQKVGPNDPPSSGGAEHAILGTLWQVGLATVLCVPIGIMSAVYLHEVRGRIAKIVRFLVDAMSGVPSIVAGLFIYTFWVLKLHNGFSGEAAALALSVLMLPTIVRTGEEMLKLVPGSLREASLALGAPEWRTVVRVVLPTARAGLVTAVILGVARVAGETAPLLLTAFGTDTVNNDPTKGPQSALPLFVYKQVRFGADAAQQGRGWAGALVLILLVLVLFVAARLVSLVGRKA